MKELRSLLSVVGFFPVVSCWLVGEPQLLAPTQLIVFQFETLCFIFL